MAQKPKVAFYWCASCGGCEETIVDLDEKVLDVVAAVDIILWPCAMDFKYSDIEAMADGSITVSFVNGAIRTSEQEHVARLLRKKSTLIVAFGDCAWMGGIPAMTNLKSKKEIFNRSYLESPTVVNPEKTVPQVQSVYEGIPMTLPEFYDTVFKLDDVIDVDYYLPGCPPTAKLVLDAVLAILAGKLPERKSVLASDKTLCSSCDRNETKPDSMTMKEIKRVHQVVADPKTCFLAQGIVCMGPATRDGCDYPCVKGNMPCTGCFGPVSGADQGARMIAALGGIIDAENNDDVDRIVSQLPDPAGTFYRYGMAASLLGSKRKEKA
jgi:F420-non-reducing hydrogenase small subunit